MALFLFSLFPHSLAFFYFVLRYVEVRPNNTDVEVVLANAYICLPESQWDCNAALAGSGGGGGPAVVAHADVTLTQQWRGMPQVCVWVCVYCACVFYSSLDRANRLANDKTSAFMWREKTGTACISDVLRTPPLIRVPQKKLD